MTAPKKAKQPPMAIVTIEHIGVMMGSNLKGSADMDKTDMHGCLLEAAGCKQVAGVSPIRIFECTLTEDPARRILEAFDAAWNEGQAPKFDDILRAIACQHPGLVNEFKHLPWPGDDVEIDLDQD